MRRTTVQTLIFILQLLAASIVWPDSSAHTAERRERCVAILRDAMVSGERFWIKVHAAEALLRNVYTEGVADYFKSIESDRVLRESSIIGICRVLAQAHKKNAVLYQGYINRIRDEFLDASSPNRVGALESLGKLGYSERLPEIVHAAGEGGSDIRGMARWVLANSGNTQDEAYLAELLNSEEPKDYFYASYALRFMGTVREETYRKLEACASRLSHDAPYREYVLSALYVHAPREKKNKALEELVPYTRGEATERYEVCEALAICGDQPDIPILERLLDDPDTDVRVAASNALLRIERREFRGLAWPDWAVIILYAFAMLAIGWFYAKRQKTTEEYLVGSRRVNSFIAGISLFASFISTITYLAIAGEVIKHGPLLILINIATFPVVYFITAYLLIPFFMKLPITSAYEIIEKPLGMGVRITGSIIFLLTRFVWMALLIFLTSKALVVMLNWDESMIPYISITAGLITVIYSTMGGLRAVLVTDVTQFFILVLGAVLTVGVITVTLGNAGALFPTEWAPNWDRLVFFSLDPHIRLTVFFSILHNVAWWVSTAGSDQMAIQRFIATKDLKGARRTFLYTMISEKSLFLILTFVGFALLSYYRMYPYHIPDGKDLITDADFLFPDFIANHLPIGASGLVIAAIFSAAMSSLSGGINSTVAVITTDIIPWITRKRGTDKSHLRLAKISSLIIGILVIAISSTMGYVPGNINEITTKTNGLFISPLFNLFFMAFFVRSATPFGTIMGAIYGFFFAFFIAFWDVLTGQPGLTFLWIGPGSLVVAVGMSLLFSLIPTRGKRIRTKLMFGIILIVPIIAALVFVMK